MTHPIFLIWPTVLKSNVNTVKPESLYESLMKLQGTGSMAQKTTSGENKCILTSTSLPA